MNKNKYREADTNEPRPAGAEVEQPEESGKSIKYPEPKEMDKRPLGAIPIKDIDEEEFIKEHPGLKGRISLTDGYGNGVSNKKGYTYEIDLEDIHETQLDKAKVRGAIDKKITFLEYILKKDVPDVDKLVNQLGVNVAIIQLKELKKEFGLSDNSAKGKVKE